MRVTQGTFLVPARPHRRQILAQIEYASPTAGRSVEYTDDPHPRNTYWEMYGLPMFDLKDAAGIMMEVNACREAFPNHYIRVTAFDATRGVETLRMSFIVNRPKDEPGLPLARQEVAGRHSATRRRATRRPARRRALLTQPRRRLHSPLEHALGHTRRRAGRSTCRRCSPTRASSEVLDQLDRELSGSRR